MVHLEILVELPDGWRATLADGYAPVRERLLALLDPWPGMTVLELAGRGRGHRLRGGRATQAG